VKFCGGMVCSCIWGGRRGLGGRAVRIRRGMTRSVLQSVHREGLERRQEADDCCPWSNAGFPGGVTRGYQTMM
jgi:hypothetical protein